MPGPIKKMIISSAEKTVSYACLESFKEIQKSMLEAQKFFQQTLSESHNSFLHTSEIAFQQLVNAEKTFRVKEPGLPEYKNTIGNPGVLPVPDKENDNIKKRNTFTEDATWKINYKPVNGRVNEAPESILLTGATGFLGAFLLTELLKETKAKIYCLVRAKDEATAYIRVITNLKENFIDYSGYEDRIIPIVGDISREYLGLGEAKFYRLAEVIDWVYHNGAMVNFVYDYQRLKATNVDSTIEVIRFASFGKSKVIHYISTMTVLEGYFKRNETYDEEQLIELDDTHTPEIIGYSKSKWVADKLMQQAIKKGYQVVIYRPGLIYAHSKTGKINDTDAFTEVVKFALDSGYVSDEGIAYGNGTVDFVSSAIVNLSLQKENLNQVFHLNGCQTIDWKQFTDFMSSYGFNLKVIKWEKWLDNLDKCREHPCYKYYRLLKNNFIDRKIEHPDNFNKLNVSLFPIRLSKTRAALGNLNLKAPEITRELLFAYFTNLTNLSAERKSKYLVNEILHLGSKFAKN
jgi:thioester reductase-like protein